jgi:hypothetical protein
VRVQKCFVQVLDGALIKLYDVPVNVVSVKAFLIDFAFFRHEAYPEVCTIT